MATAKKGMSGRTKAAIGVGAGLVAAGVAAYLLTGKRGTKNRTAMKAWAGKMQKEVGQKLATMKTVGKAQYHQAISEVAKRYKNIDQAELDSVVADLQKHWQNLGKNSAKKSAAKRRK